NIHHVPAELGEEIQTSAHITPPRSDRQPVASKQRSGSHDARRDLTVFKPVDIITVRVSLPAADWLRGRDQRK
ncbi:hypothetical protein KUCAC02_014987, partial [Chaenocephalus aceratus]